MPSCVVKTCKNSHFKKPHGITFHVFPRHAKRKDDWVLIIRNCRGDNNWNPSTRSTVCSAHFDEDDFITTAKGLRCLVPCAIPKKLLSKTQSLETQTPSKSSHILQKSPNAKGVASDEQPPSSPSTISSLLQDLQVPEPVLTDELALTGYCRLCAASKCDGMVVNIQSENGLKKIVVNMSNRLNINIDFSQELLPTIICSVCVKSLYTAYDFVVGIDLAQMTLNKILMQKYKYQKLETKKEIINQLGNNLDFQSSQQVSANIGTAESHFEPSLPFVAQNTTSVPPLVLNTGTSDFDHQPLLLELNSAMPVLLDSPENRRLQDNLDKKKQIIESQKKIVKRLNQKVRRLQNRNESLKSIFKNLKERNNVGTDLYNTSSENIVAADLFTRGAEKDTDLDNTTNENIGAIDLFTCKAEKDPDLKNTLNENIVAADLFTYGAEIDTDLDNTSNENIGAIDLFICKAEKGPDLNNTLNENIVAADLFTFGTENDIDLDNTSRENIGAIDLFTCKAEKGPDLDNTLNENIVATDLFTCKAEKSTDQYNTWSENIVAADLFTCKAEKGTDVGNTFNENIADIDLFTCKAEKEY